VCHTEEPDEGGRLEVGPLVEKFNRINCFLFTFCHDTKSNKSRILRYKQTFRNIFFTHKIFPFSVEFSQPALILQMVFVGL